MTTKKPYGKSKATEKPGGKPKPKKSHTNGKKSAPTRKGPAAKGPSPKAPGRSSQKKHGRPPGTRPNNQGVAPKPESKPARTDGGRSHGRPGRRVEPKDNVFNMRVEQIKIRLDELKQYKKILEEEGLKPDVDDKVLETQLIRRLLWLEKQHALVDAEPLAPPPEEDAPSAPSEPKKTRRGKARGR